MDRDSLVEDLRGRLGSATESGDATPVLDAVAAALARDLAGVLAAGPRDGAAVDVDAIGLLVAVHWIRCRLLPRAAGGDDLMACLGWSAVLLPAAPGLVPEPVRVHLTEVAARAGTYGSSIRAAVLLREYGRTGDVEQLDAAVAAGRDAVAASPPDDPDRPGHLSNLGVALWTRSQRTGCRQDLDEAVAVDRQAVAATPPGHPGRPGFLAGLAGALQLRYGQGGRQSDLDEAIAVARDAVTATAPDDPDRPMYLSNLGVALRARFELVGHGSDLEEAVAAGRDAVEATPPEHPHRCGYLTNLGSALLTRFERTGQPADLDRAVAAARDAVAATSPDRPDRPGCLGNLGNALWVRSGRTGAPDDLDRAVDLFRAAAAATTGGHPARPRHLSSLGGALRIRFERTGRQSDLDEGIAVGREAVAATPVDHPDRPVLLSNLAGALLTRFGRTGQRPDLEQAVAVGRDAVAATPAGHARRPGHLSNLAVALRTRFELTGQRLDVDEAIAIGQEAVAATPLDHPERPWQLSVLGAALMNRFERTGYQPDLDRAVSVGREAVAGTAPDHPARARYLSTLGETLRTRFERTGQRPDLEDAVAAGRDAVAATPAGHPERAVWLSNLGHALWLRFERTGHRSELDEAIAVGEQAVAAAPPDHPRRASYLIILGTALWTRSGLTGRRDLDRATELHREGSAVPTASPWMRLQAARGWGACLTRADRAVASVEAYEVAVGLLPLVVWHGLDRRTLEHHLRESAGLAGEAAAAAVAAGDPRRAVELAEAARAMLWTQALHLRQDLTALRQRAPRLAAALDGARAVLDRAPGPADDPAGDESPAAEQRMLADRRQAARDWDTAVEEVRRLDGFGHFLRPVPFAELRPAAAAGPVVVVTVSAQGSHALVVTPPTAPGDGVLVVDLPAATPDAVAERVDTLLAARSRDGDPDLGWSTAEADRQAVLDVLAWTWHAVTGPVLAALGRTGTPAGPVEDWPRVWWCPTGAAAVLPLHAAGIHPREATRHAAPTGESVAERVVSSYTPTLAALARARARPAPGQVRVMAVGVPDAPGYVPGAGPLPAVLPELRALAGHLPSTSLTGSGATRDRVLRGLPDHSWLHLSCHGLQHPVDASRSAFLLPDRPLTLADLAALDLPAADLAYLAACQTATGDAQLLDEALHLAAALQLVGYRHVLATLWTISDTAAPAMADTVYAHLARPDPDHPAPGDRPDSARAAYALHHAVARLRRTHPGEPLTWAPYVHLGP